MSALGDVAQVLTAVAAVGAVANSWRNSIKLDKQGQKIDAVHTSTNGLAKRNEQIAEKLGITKGVAQEKANPTA